MIRRLAFRALDLAYSFSGSAVSHRAVTGPADNLKPRISIDDALVSLFARRFNRTIRLNKEHVDPWPAPAFRFGWEAIDSEEFQEFRDEAAFLLDGCRDPFELSERWRRLTGHAVVAQPSMPDDPLEYLRLARQGVGMTCRYFALAYVALATALGMPARLLGLSEFGTAWDHEIAEVYCPAEDRWIVIDPDFNVAYRRSGVWLSAADLHAAWMGLVARFPKSLSLAEVHERILSEREAIINSLDFECVALGSAGAELRATNLEPSLLKNCLQYYQHVLYVPRNDFRTNRFPKGHPRRSRMFQLADNPLSAPLLPICPEAYARSESALYPSLGGVAAGILAVDRRESGFTIDLALDANWPYFAGFEVATDYDKKPAFISGPGFRWKLANGKNRLEVTPINAMKCCGRRALVEIDLADANAT